MRVCISNLGCKLNQAEVEKIARELISVGHEIVSDLAQADLHVINTCTVTHMAARDSRKLARRGRRVNRRLRTVVTGCYASEDAEAAARLNGVDLVVTNDEKDRLVERLHQAFPDAVPEAGGQIPVPYVPLELGNTRATVKIEDGCNMRCAFCIIPLTRGAQRSRALADVIAEVQGLAGAGYKEIVVTGVQISSYRDNGHRLCDLTRALLEETKVARLRLTSIAPWEFDRRLLPLWSDDRLCRHLHFSLQSGSTATLRRMRRPYRAADFAALLDEVRAAVPGVAVTTDVIVGFPGESRREFEESLAFVEAMQFARVHVFPYSVRPGTAAAGMNGQLEPEEKKARVAAMMEVAEAGLEQFHRRHLGSRVEVLWEGERRGTWQGLTDNYVRVFAASDQDLHNRLVPARVVEVTAGGVVGHTVD